MYRPTRMALIQHTMDNNKKLKFANIARDYTGRVAIKEDKTKEYVKFGEYNDFPNSLIELYNNSSIHNTCVNAIVDGIVGEGLTADPAWVLDVANSTGESWNDLLRKVAVDYKLYGGFSLEIIWNKARTKIAEVYHIDFSWVRAREKNYRGQIPGYYISDEWSTKYRFSGYNVNKLPYLPAFNPQRSVEEPKQLYVCNPYRPGQGYYPLPDYVGALRVIDLDTEIDNFHVNNLKNGLAPSLMITTFTNANEDEREAIERMLQLQYSGTNNAGNLLYMDLDDPANAPQVTPIPQNGADGYYTTINDMVVQKILTAHRITSPMILGIKTEGQLGGRDEVVEAYLLLVNTVIRPFQQEILQVFEDLLEMKYPELDITLGIQQLKLFSDGEEETDVVTSIDAEVGEDSELEADIETADREAGEVSGPNDMITELPLA